MPDKKQKRKSASFELSTEFEHVENPNPDTTDGQAVPMHELECPASVKCTRTTNMQAEIDRLNGELHSVHAHLAHMRRETARLRSTLQVIAANPGWLDHHCRAQAALAFKAQERE